MQTINHSFVRFQALAIAVLLMLNTAYCWPLSAKTFDDLDYSDLTKLASLETIVYGNSYKYLPGDKRIGSLEKILFGKVHSGPLHNRIFALADAISGPRNNLLAPPVAPQLDHTNSETNSPLPRIAPDINGKDSPPPSEAQLDRIKVMLQQATQLYGQGQSSQAETIFKQVLKIDSQNEDANFNLGAIAEGRSDWQSASHYYQAALRANPSDNEIKNAVASMQAKIAASNNSVNSNAQGIKQTLSSAQIESLKAKVNQAASDYQAGNYDAAIINLKAVLAQAPDQADVYYALAQAYKGKKQYSQASAALNQAIKLSPSNQQYKDSLSEITNLSSSSHTAGDSFASNNPDIANNPQKYKAAKNKAKQDDWQEDDTPPSQKSDGPIGEITPFSDAGSSQLGGQLGWQPTSAGQSYGTSSYYMPSLSGGYMPGYTYSNSIPYGMSSRLERAAITGLAGAAIGMFAGYSMRGGGRRW